MKEYVSHPVKKQLGNHRTTATNSTEVLEDKIGKIHKAIEKRNGEIRLLEDESTVLKQINNWKGRKKSSEEQFKEFSRAEENNLPDCKGTLSP